MTPTDRLADVEPAGTVPSMTNGNAWRVLLPVSTAGPHPEQVQSWSPLPVVAWPGIVTGGIQGPSLSLTGQSPHQPVGAAGGTR